MSCHWMKQLSRMAALVLLALVSLSGRAAAQQGGQTLVPGVIATGTLDQSRLAQVYTFAGTAGQGIKLSVTGDSDVILLLSDSEGVVLGQAAARGGTAALPDITLTADAAYYVTVFPAVGVENLETIRFQLSLAVTDAAAPAPTATPEAQAAQPASFEPPGELLTATGLQVTLTWNSVANLDLEVRDPVGGSLFFNTPTTPSGGTFGVNVNSVCATRTADAPTERASWRAGVIPTGSYEILVYYDPLTDCPTTEPVTFTLNVNVDGRQLAPVEGTLSPNQVYLASFVVKADGSAEPGLNGIKVDPPTVRADALTGEPVTLIRDVPAQGALTSQQYYQLYTFTGRANELVSIAMNANSGSLDPLLLVLDPNGNIVAFNDDAGPGNTDSLVSNLTLLLPGTYTVVATRYGQALGGTQGGYELTLTGPTTAALPDFPDLPNGSVEVSVQWSTGADVRLLVRDPQGNTVFDDVPQVPASGARLITNGNLNCAQNTPSPLSYAYWPEGRLPAAGPYEIEVRLQSLCNDQRPVVFVLNVVANGQLVMSRTQPLLLNERYVTSYTIDLTGQVQAGEGGIFGTSQRPDFSSLDVASQLATAQVLTSGQSVTGRIQLNKKFDVYVFEGTAGSVVTISMEGLSGTLDPVLFLLDPNQIQIAANDDAGRDTTNSLINEFTLPEDGRYIIIATHFGARYGVTAGDYRLTLRLN